MRVSAELERRMTSLDVRLADVDAALEGLTREADRIALLATSSWQAAEQTLTQFSSLSRRVRSLEDPDRREGT